MVIDIPGYKSLDLRYLILDYNGTIAVDGIIPERIQNKIKRLSEKFKIYIVSGDTHGNVKEACRKLPVEIYKCSSREGAQSKADFVKKLGGEHCICLGNGRIDMLMFEEAELCVAVMDEEGVYGKLIWNSDICVRSMDEALDLLEKPKRLIAGLRG